MAFSAVLLAAGRSTRMGRDKALLEFAGTPLWQHQRDTLARAGAAEILLSARPEQAWAQSAAARFAAVLHDAQPDCGPLIGLTAGLERSTHPHLAVLAIDLPRVTAEWFTARRDECTADVGVVGRRGMFFEPLAAIYPRDRRDVRRKVPRGLRDVSPFVRPGPNRAGRRGLPGTLISARMRRSSGGHRRGSCCPRSCSSP